jgi:hypothetical protein
VCAGGVVDTLAGNTTAASQTWEPLRAAALMAGVEVFLDAAEPEAL